MHIKHIQRSASNTLLDQIIPLVIIHNKATVMSLGMALIYDHDYCLHATCAENADCSEIQFGHKCSCNRGYKGDGINFCNDIDECSLANRKWA